MKTTKTYLFSLIVAILLCVHLAESVPIILQNRVTKESCYKFLRSLEQDPTRTVSEFSLINLRNMFNKCSNFMNPHDYQSADYYDYYQTRNLNEDSYENDDIDD
jgi:hypothetical protein